MLLRGSGWSQIARFLGEIILVIETSFLFQRLVNHRYKEWQDALNQTLKMGVRVEQQAFAKHGLNYVLDSYLPDKIKKAKFLP